MLTPPIIAAAIAFLTLLVALGVHVAKSAYHFGQHEQRLSNLEAAHAALAAAHEAGRERGAASDIAVAGLKSTLDGINREIVNLRRDIRDYMGGGKDQ